MIKTHGFGRRSDKVSHEASIEHHKSQHSKLGLAQADHMGRYVLYYFNSAYSGRGEKLDDFPWDMSALEWFSDDDRWHNFKNWQDSAADGQEVKEDEERFLDRAKCYLSAYDEDAIVTDASAVDALNVIRVVKFKGGVDRAEGQAQHKRVVAPFILDAFGDSLKKLTVNYPYEAISLAEGSLAELPMHAIEIYKLDKSILSNPNDLGHLFSQSEFTKATMELANGDETWILEGEERIYI